MEEKVYNHLDRGLNQDEIEKIRAFIIKSNTLLLPELSSMLLEKMFKKMFDDMTTGKK